VVTNIISRIHNELKKNIDETYKQTESRLFKEGRACYGVRTGIVRKIAEKYFPSTATKKEVFNLCEEFLQSQLHEPRTIAFQWAYGVRKQYAQEDFAVFET